MESGIARTVSPWRDLRSEFGLWNSVYQRFAPRPRQRGVFLWYGGNANGVIVDVLQIHWVSDSRGGIIWGGT